MCYFGLHIPTGWWVVNADTVDFLKHKDFVRKETMFVYRWTLSGISGNSRQMRHIFMLRSFQRSCLYYSDLSTFLPHFGSVDLILNILWNKLYIWLKDYSVWSKMASKSLSTHWLERKEEKNSSEKWFLLPNSEFSFSGYHNLTKTQGKQEADDFYALGVSEDMNYNGKQYSTF